MNLNETLVETRKQEREHGFSCLVYKVFNGGDMIYVGLGGKGKRIGSGRLAEHKGNSVFSSFKYQFYMEGWDNGYTRKEVDVLWNELEWEVTLFHNKSDMLELESQLIETFTPYYNRTEK